MAMGKKIIHAGAIGAGQKLKMVNQIVCALHIVALGEGFAAARALQLDLSQARDLLTSGAARSWALEVYGEKVLDGDFAPGFPLKWQTKDMRIATEALGEMGLDLPGVRMAYERLKEAVRRGFGDEGSHAIYKLYL
jgi:3-hydroxyisobutyrate dehydrogenase-like beta-hydroxyacid dehydrogenase